LEFWTRGQRRELLCFWCQGCDHVTKVWSRNDWTVSCIVFVSGGV
jgi:ribosomal protein S27E